MMKQNKYFWTSIGLYINFFVQGIETIIIAQNINMFARMRGTDTAGVMEIIAAVGIGKVVVLLFAGVLADKLGRKPFIYIGMIGYILFFGGLLLNTDLRLAYVVAFTAGAATSFLDAATYPALMEIYPENTSSASVVVKGFISAPGMVVPIFIGLLNNKGFWPGWSLVIPMVIVMFNCIFLLKARFPDQDMRKLRSDKSAKDMDKAGKGITFSVEDESEFAQKPSYKVEGLILMLYSFCCMATFYLFQQVITLYGVQVIGMSELASRALLTYYTAGSFIAVFLSAVMMTRGVRDMAIMVVYGFISSATLIIVYLFPNQVVVTIGAFIIGFTVADGVLQAGIAMLCRFFPYGKGKNTSLYDILFSLATCVMPIIASHMMKTDFTKVMLLDAVTALGGFVLMLLLSFRYKKVFGINNIFSRVF